MTRSPPLWVAPELLTLFYRNHIHKQTLSIATQNSCGYRIFCGLNKGNQGEWLNCDYETTIEAWWNFFNTMFKPDAIVTTIMAIENLILMFLHTLVWIPIDHVCDQSILKPHKNLIRIFFLTRVILFERDLKSLSSSTKFLSTQP